MGLRLGIMTIAARLQEFSQKQGTEDKALLNSLTGCVDEQDGRSLLIHGKELHLIARLQPAAGSADQTIARHIGHEITVRGGRSNEGAVPVTTVEDVETVAKGCAPAPSEA
jgi:hypothetical protein